MAIFVKLAWLWGAWTDLCWLGMPQASLFGWLCTCKKSEDSNTIKLHWLFNNFLMTNKPTGFLVSNIILINQFSIWEHLKKWAILDKFHLQGREYILNITKPIINLYIYIYYIYVCYMCVCIHISISKAQINELIYIYMCVCVCVYIC